MEDNFYDFDGVVVRRAKASDVQGLQLRQSDIEEVWATGHFNPGEALRLSMECSAVCFTVEDNGKPIAMFGLNAESIIGKRAVIWLLASSDLKTRAVRFIRHSKKFIVMLLEFYPYLFNFVDDRNKDSIDWLRRCGANIGEPQPFGIDQKLFRYFYFTRN